MSDTKIKVSDPDRLVLYGDLNFEHASELIITGKELIDHAPKRFYIDLHHVKQVSSVGLAILLKWLRCARQQEKQVTFINTPSKLAGIALVSGFVIGVNGISTLENH